MAAGPYDAPGNITLTEFVDTKEFSDRATAPGAVVDLRSSAERVKIGNASGELTASNSTGSPEGTWCKVEKLFSPVANLAAHQALGVWIHGDGQGEVLNLQLTNPPHFHPAAGEHYVDIDFTGWRYFELIEPESTRNAEFQWPYDNSYAVYRNQTEFSQIERLALWFNHLPPKGSVTCYVSPIRAIPLVPSTLIHPTVTIGDRTIMFPIGIPTGHYLEFEPGANAKLYGPQGQLMSEVKPVGVTPVVAKGSNDAQFECKTPAGLRPRAYVTVVTQGEPVA